MERKVPCKIIVVKQQIVCYADSRQLRKAIMKVTHSDIVITYIEGDNQWHFELCGRQRKAESLAKAKEAIDKEPVEKRKQTFPRFEAYMKTSFERDYSVVSVTSLAENHYGRDTHFWVVDKRGNRSKENAVYIYPVNDANTAVVAEMMNIVGKIEILEKEKSMVAGKLQCSTVPKELK